MTGSGVPTPPLDNSDDTLPNPYSLTTALEHAYYQRDVESLRRIGHQAERQIAELQRRLLGPPAG